jgi:hypothetical protein
MQILQNLSMIIGLIAHYHTNSTYYSAIKPPPLLLPVPLTLTSAAAVEEEERDNNPNAGIQRKRF